MNKAIFLDRDGVINEKRNDYVKSLEELNIFPFVATAIKKLHSLNFLVIVITNQSAVNRGLISHKKLSEIHNTIQNHMMKNNTSIDAFYYCPHKPDENCNCRKPKSGLLLKAIQAFNIDPALSWMIGDSDSDIIAGKSVGANTAKIEKEKNLDRIVEKIIHSYDISKNN